MRSKDVGHPGPDAAKAPRKHPDGGDWAEFPRLLMSAFDPLRTLDEHGTMLGMGRFLKKSAVVEAVQWFKLGDHPAVLAGSARDPIGYIETPEGRLRVEAGDWIITGVAGENYPCKPDIFEQLYTPAD